MRRTPVALALIAAGCSTSLAGSWEGDFTCPDTDPFTISFDLEKDGGAFVGDGRVSDFVVEWKGEWYDARYAFDLELDKTAPYAEQDLDWSFSNCEIILVDVGSGELDCSPGRNLEWDGADTITGKLADFLGSGVACSFEATR